MPAMNIDDCRKDLEKLNASAGALDLLLILESYLNIGQCFQHAGGYSESIELFTKLKEGFPSLDKEDQESFSMFIICAHRNSGNCHRALGNMAEARRNLEVARQMSIQYKDYLRLGKASIDYADLLVELSEPQAGCDALEAAERMMLDNDIPEDSDILRQVREKLAWARSPK